MKTSSISLTSIALVLCGLYAASSQALQAQKKGVPIVPVVSDNANNNNNNQNPPPPPAAVVKKALPRKVVKTKVQVAPSISKQLIPPAQKRVEQPKLPLGMKRMGPGAASNDVRNLAKLKLLPPMKRKQAAVVVKDASFPSIGAASLDRLGNRIHDIAFGQAANDFKEIGDAAGFADLIGGSGDEMQPELGLGSGQGAGQDQFNKFFGPGEDDRFGGLGFFPDATAPQNNGGKTPKGSSGAPFRPENPEDALAGAAYDHPPFYSAEADLPNSMFVRNTQRSGDGSIKVTSTFFDSRGNIHMVVDSYPAGSEESTRRHLTAFLLGGESTTTTTYDKDGQVVGVTLPQTTSPPEGDPDGNPDPDNADPNGKWARWWASNGTGRRPDLGMKTPNQVNPGDPDYEGAEAGAYPSIGAKFAGNIAVNPDPNLMSGGGRNPSARAWRLMKQDLINGVNPGPITEPGD
ncbi:MAG: hypothetical protein QM496_18835 [Verrucomicrobiota bacterium]